MKNNEFLKLIVYEVIFITIIVLLNISFFYYNFNNYKKYLNYNNSLIIGNILKNHPSLESEIIKNIQTSDLKIGQEFLEKYSLDDIANLEYLDNLKKFKKDMFLNNVIFALISILIVLIVNILFILKIYKKIRNIDIYLNKVLQGNYNLDIIDYNEGDISNLKNDIYKITVMLKKQANDLKKEKKYLEDTLSDISHQIKTPLTSMYVINDLLVEDVLNETQKQEMLVKNKNQLERIEWLVTSLLNMSMMDSGTIKFKKEKVNVLNLINEALEPLKIPIEIKNLELEVLKDPNIFITADYKWTKEALINIIKNAYEHTDKGKITISFTDNPIYTEISIKDSGCGIRKKDLPHIFERFYKTNSKSNSIGIGLNLALKIIQKQNGNILVESKINKGTTFKIQIYKNII